MPPVSGPTPALVEPQLPGPGPGRPSIYDEFQVEEILHRVAAGESLNKICKGTDSRGKKMPSAGAFLVWHVHDDPPGISAKYRRACEARAELWADEVVDVADASTGEGGDPDPKSRAVRIDARKWVASRLLKIYADRQTVSIEDPDAVLARALGVRKEELPEPERATAPSANASSVGSVEGATGASIDIRSHAGGTVDLDLDLDKHRD